MLLCFCRRKFVAGDSTGCPAGLPNGNRGSLDSRNRHFQGRGRFKGELQDMLVVGLMHWEGNAMSISQLKAVGETDLTLPLPGVKSIANVDPGIFEVTRHKKAHQRCNDAPSNQGTQIGELKLGSWLGRIGHLKFELK